MESRKRTVLSIQDKAKAIELSEKGLSSRKISEIFKCGKTQINNVLKRKREVLEDLECNVDPERKRRRHITGNEEINELCWKWFQDATKRRICVTGPLLQEQARKFSTQLNNDSFTASNGWLESFRKRHNISFGLMSGERGDVNTDTVNDWKEKLKLICKGYEPKNIFNMDETGLFFRETTRKTLFVKGDDCAGGKKVKGQNNCCFMRLYVRGKGQTFINCQIQKSKIF